jgi:hypothetical protein
VVITALKLSASHPFASLYSNIRHVSGYVDQTHNRGIISRFGCDSAAVAARDKYAWAVLLSYNAFRCLDIVFK